ncbi:MULTISPECIES: hypothetical protein [Sphingobacterium]|uniref:Phosphatidate cytidylyltransferase n=1 Tax=Sphingobacterium tenebrionis TaxID=3111775 RepID=A0ABU8I7S3_9SPHI|nr:MULTISPECIES: hypothetical protein [unclassified Sphingobacterium]QBR12259.1 hypothetical protein E3D81_08835 [Sphingobacterium sp. CZ-2]
MKRINGVLLLFLMTNLLTGCSVIEGIFKAGLWSGIIFVVVIVALLIWLITRFMGGGGNRQ